LDYGFRYGLLLSTVKQKALITERFAVMLGGRSIFLTRISRGVDIKCDGAGNPTFDSHSLYSIIRELNLCRNRIRVWSYEYDKNDFKFIKAARFTFNGLKGDAVTIFRHSKDIQSNEIAEKYFVRLNSNKKHLNKNNTCPKTTRHCCRIHFG
jgi:hypothetical protein